MATGRVRQALHQIIGLGDGVEPREVVKDIEGHAVTYPMIGDPQPNSDSYACCRKAPAQRRSHCAENATVRSVFVVGATRSQGDAPLSNEHGPQLRQLDSCQLTAKHQLPRRDWKREGDHRPGAVRRAPRQCTTAGKRRSLAAYHPAAEGLTCKAIQGREFVHLGQLSSRLRVNAPTDTIVIH